MVRAIAQAAAIRRVKLFPPGESLLEKRFAWNQSGAVSAPVARFSKQDRVWDA
jgi:hypothetical protein